MFADMKSENGRPAGYGTVRFKNPDDAVTAISILWTNYLFRMLSLIMF